MKYVNVRTANEFHDWQRAHLPSWFVIQDLDTWVLMPADSTDAYEPRAIIEEKRSFSEPEDWKPYKDDLPNYVALYRLSQRARLPFWIIYFKKGEPLKKVALFEVLQVDANSSQWIRYKKHVYAAKELEEKFISIFAQKREL